jgi:hypothetical protein
MATKMVTVTSATVGLKADLPDALTLIATTTMTASAPKTNSAAASAIVSLVLTL